MAPLSRRLKKVVVGKHSKNFLPMQPGDVPVTFADVDELIDEVGFKPETSIGDGIRKFVNWYGQSVKNMS